MTVLSNVMVESVFFLHKLIYAGSHRAYCTSEVMRGQSKTISDFTFDTHHGKEALLTFTCTEY